MSYNRKNLIKRILEVQKITLEKTKEGITQQWVYDNLIYPNYFISQRTFYEYLGTNAKAEQKAIDLATGTKPDVKKPSKKFKEKMLQGRGLFD